MKKRANALYKQFYSIHHESLNYLIVRKNDNASEYKGGPNLFGWDGVVNDYTSRFKLELVYD